MKIMNILSNLENGHRPTQNKVYVTLFVTALVVVTVLQLTGVIHLITK